MSGVVFLVFFLGEEFQVSWAVVSAVVIAVVNLVPRGNPAMHRSPNRAVEKVPGRVVVVPSSGVAVVAVPIEFEPSGRSCDGVIHPISISPGSTFPAMRHSCSLTAIRWSGVHRSTPTVVVTATVARLTPVLREALTRRQPRRVATQSPSRTSSIGTSPRAVTTGVPLATHHAPLRLAPRSRSGRSAEYP